MKFLKGRVIFNSYPNTTGFVYFWRFPVAFEFFQCLRPMLQLIFRKFYGQFASANNGEICMTKDHQLPPQYPRVAPSWKYLANQKV